jgi:hypothetical protein
VKLDHEPHEHHDEELLHTHAGQVNVETSLDDVRVGTGAGHGTANTLDAIDRVSLRSWENGPSRLGSLHESDNVSPHKPLGDASRVDTTDPSIGLGQEVVSLTRECHVDECVDPKRSEQEQDGPTSGISDLLLVERTERVENEGYRFPSGSHD